MYKCPKCGQVFEGEARFCPNCGQPFVYPAQEDEGKTLHVYLHHVKEEEEAPKKEEPLPIEEPAPAKAEEEPEETETVGKPVDNAVQRKYVASAVFGAIANLMGLGLLVFAVVFCYVVPVGFLNGETWSFRAEVATTLNYFINSIKNFDGTTEGVIGLVAQIIPLCLALIGAIFAIVDFFVLCVYGAKSHEKVSKLAISTAGGKGGKGVASHVWPAFAFIFGAMLIYNVISCVLLVIYQNDGFPIIDFKWDHALFTYIAIGVLVVYFIFAIIASSILRSVKKDIRKTLLLN